MTTKTTKTKKKVAKKVITNKPLAITVTKGQLENIAKFYVKNNKKVPVFITKKLEA